MAIRVRETKLLTSMSESDFKISKHLRVRYQTSEDSAKLRHSAALAQEEFMRPQPLIAPPLANVISHVALSIGATGSRKLLVCLQRLNQCTMICFHLIFERQVDCTRASADISQSSYIFFGIL